MPHSCAESAAEPATVEVARPQDVGNADATFQTRAHLGSDRLAPPGDLMLGYDLETSNVAEAAATSLVRTGFELLWLEVG